jgi:hypothetical protein
LLRTTAQREISRVVNAASLQEAFSNQSLSHASGPA